MTWQRPVQLSALCLTVWLALALTTAGSAEGHGQPPVVLSLVEVSSARFTMTLRSPLRSDRNAALPLVPVFPDHCRQKGPELDCRGPAGGAQGLRGQLLAVAPSPDGEPSASELIYVITWLGGQRESGLLRPLPDQDRSRLSAAQPSAAAVESALSVGSRYLRLGLSHILAPLQGADHLLFVLGLMLLVADLGALLWCVTAFTLGHSLTLSVSALDLVRLPTPPVEAMIALSIVFIAQELVRTTEVPRDLPPRRARRAALTAPPILAIGFGLLHGLGFASALAEAGLPTTQRALALLSFNVGVELGQLAWVVLWLPLWRLYRRRAQPPARRALRLAPAYVLGSLSAALSLSRLFDVFFPPG